MGNPRSDRCASADVEATWTRRRFVTTAGLAVAATVVGPVSEVRAAAQRGGFCARKSDRAWVDFTTKRNGSAPTTADSGHPLRFTGSAVFAVVDGSLVDAAASARPAAGYSEVPLSDNVNRIGAEFGWIGTGAVGQAALVLWQASRVDTFPSVPAARCHFVIADTCWSYGIWPSQGANRQIVLKTGTFGTALARGERHHVEIAIDHDAACLTLPDGSAVTISDPRIASLAGPYACWESFYTHAATEIKPRFYRIWASAEPGRPR